MLCMHKYRVENDRIFFEIPTTYFFYFVDKKKQHKMGQANSKYIGTYIHISMMV